MRDARYHVAASFMLVLPKVFSEELLNEYDASGSTVEWEDFLSKLTSFYQAHMSPEHDDIQTHSIFEGCDASQLVYQKASYSPYVDHDDRNAFNPPLEHFTTNIVESNEDNLPSIPDSEDKILFSTIKFFIPVLIWAFNELKDALLVDEGVLGQFKLLLEESYGALKNEYSEYLDLDQFRPDRERFLVGTGFEIRKADEWKKISETPTGEDRESQNTGSEDSAEDTPSVREVEQLDLPTAPTTSVFDYMASQVPRNRASGFAEHIRASLKRKRTQAPGTYLTLF